MGTSKEEEAGEHKAIHNNEWPKVMMMSNGDVWKKIRLDEHKGQFQQGVWHTKVREMSASLRIIFWAPPLQLEFRPLEEAVVAPDNDPFGIALNIVKDPRLNFWCT